MISFLIPAFLLLVLVLVLLLRPFIFPPKVEATSRRQMKSLILVIKLYILSIASNLSFTSFKAINPEIEL